MVRSEEAPPLPLEALAKAVGRALRDGVDLAASATVNDANEAGKCGFEMAKAAAEEAGTPDGGREAARVASGAAAKAGGAVQVETFPPRPLRLWLTEATASGGESSGGEAAATQGSASLAWCFVTLEAIRSAETRAQEEAQRALKTQGLTAAHAPEQPGKGAPFAASRGLLSGGGFLASDVVPLAYVDRIERLGGWAATTAHAHLGPGQSPGGGGRQPRGGSRRPGRRRDLGGRPQRRGIPSCSRNPGGGGGAGFVRAGLVRRAPAAAPGGGGLRSRARCPRRRPRLASSSPAEQRSRPPGQGGLTAKNPVFGKKNRRKSRSDFIRNLNPSEIYRVIAMGLLCSNVSDQQK